MKRQLPLPIPIVLKNGTLNEAAVIKREPLYRGMNGRVIERFFITPTESYIFKPLTNDSQAGKEIWVQENILKTFPPVYPKIIASSLGQRVEDNWIIYEDLGKLIHDFSLKTLLKVVKTMAWWHSLPVGKWHGAPLRGPKPMMKEIISEVMMERERIREALFDVSIKQIDEILSSLDKSDFSKGIVLSHGDLHLGNYGLSKNKLFIIDWEHAHLNSRYWDLYHLIDLSHPMFPKIVTKEMRNDLLNDYYQEAEKFGIETNIKKFQHGYYLFSCAFSLWMILLIQGDLRRKKNTWPERALKKQLNETVSSFTQCAEEFFSMEWESGKTD